MATSNGSKDSKGQGKGGKGSYSERAGSSRIRSAVSSSYAPLSKPGDRLPKLDFRFAEVEDADDLAALVNAAFASEEALNGGFRTNSRVDVAELRAELENAHEVKWVVLETPVPEEQIVAAVAISAAAARAGSGKRTAYLRCLCVLPAWQSKGAGSILLARAEAIALQGLRCSSARVDVAHSTAESSSSTPSDRKVGVGPWLASKGYAQVGGGCWIGDAWVAPTPYETWGKDLVGSQATPTKASKPTTAPPSDAAVPHSGLPAALELAHAFAHAFADLPDSSSAETVAPRAGGGYEVPGTTTQVAEGEGAAALLQELLAPPPPAAATLSSVSQANSTRAAASRVASPAAAAAADSTAQMAGSSDGGLEALMSQLMTATKAEAASAPSGVANAGSGTGNGTASSKSGAKNSGQDDMDSLLVALMGALGTESGKAEFDSLAAAEAPLLEPSVKQQEEVSAPSLSADGDTTAASAGLYTEEAQSESGAQDSSAGSSAANGEDLDSLMGSLMSALGTASGQAEFKALVTDKDENVLGRPLN